MKVLGIEFVPFKLALKNRLEMLSAFGTFLLFPELLYIGPLITIYIVCCTRYWLVALAYLVWVFVLDSDAEYGNRRSSWVPSWTLFKYAANYYPIKFTKHPGAELDPKRNYVAGTFPHGIASQGTFVGVLTEALGFNKLFPHHVVHGVTLKLFFYVPLLRELAIALGMCSATYTAINRLLACPNGGKILGIVVGGAAEMMSYHTGQYHIVVKNRKGFVRLALMNGSPLIPIFCFGETSIYSFKIFPKGSLMKNLQEFCKRIFGLPVIGILFYGRGFFQNTFGLVPYQKPINIVAGLPIDVEKVENPTQEQIDSLHALFVERLTALFEEYKYHFEQNPETVKLIIN